MAAVVIMLGVGGGAASLPPDAGFLEWAGIFAAVVIAAASGLVGVSYVTER